MSQNRRLFRITNKNYACIHTHVGERLRVLALAVRPVLGIKHVLVALMVAFDKLAELALGAVAAQCCHNNVRLGFGWWSQHA